MKIASWNVNSVRVRAPHLERLVEEHQIDVVALQETKCSEEDFPEALLQQTHPHRIVRGNKGLSGVAFLSRYPLDYVEDKLPGAEHLPARFLHVTIGDMHLMNVYVVNGESLTSDKFVQKKDFMQGLIKYVKPFTKHPMIIMGDFNIAPYVRDVYTPQHFKDRCLFSQEERTWLRTLMAGPLYDMHHLATLNAYNTERYTWWDYRNMAYFPEKGLRIDLMLASARAMDHVRACGSLKNCRQEERPSDHIPIWCLLEGEL